MSESLSGKEATVSPENENQDPPRTTATAKTDAPDQGPGPTERKEKRGKGDGKQGKPEKPSDKHSQKQQSQSDKADKAPSTQTSGTKQAASGPKTSSQVSPPVYRLAMFDHLTRVPAPLTFEQSSQLHPSTIKLGILFRKGQLYDDDERVSALLLCLMNVIEDYSTPPNKSLSWDLDKHIKHQVSYCIHAPSFSYPSSRSSISSTPELYLWAWVQ